MELRTNWAISHHIDLYHCDPTVIKSRESIQEYVIDVCKNIELKRCADIQIVNIEENGQLIGYTMIQITDLAVLCANFCHTDNKAYFDFFVRKDFDAGLINDITRKFYKSLTYEGKVFLRK